MSPAERHRALIASGQLADDPHQRQAVELLDDLYQRLGRKQPLIRRWWARPQAETGLYLWGGVGRGKTLLMDLFHETLPHRGKLRMHFHRFMQRVHNELNRRSGSTNPLQGFADDFAKQTRILCFDEFFVADIGDAMIFGELMQAFFQRGLTLVATSNVAPDRLYDNGLQRRRFLPAIEALKRHTLIHCLDGETDYRLRVLERAEIYHAPLGEDAEASLNASFGDLTKEPGKRDAPFESVSLQLAPERHAADAEGTPSQPLGRLQSFHGSPPPQGAPPAPREPPIGRKAVSDCFIEVENRIIHARHLAPDVAWFEFSELCEGPRSQNDYIELARCFHTVLVSNVKRFTPVNEDAARRFISLVDEFYDRNVKLILSAEAPVSDLYAGERHSFEFERTRSRLLEMQSHAYLARSHQAG